MKKSSPVSRSGHFARAPGTDVTQFTESVSFDWRLWQHDIVGSMAHAMLLQKIGVLTKKELRAMVQGLDAIGKENKAGQTVPPGAGRNPKQPHFTFIWALGGCGFRHDLPFSA
jgi:argininosuccinate lyase